MRILIFGLIVSVFCLGVIFFAEIGISHEFLIPILTLLALGGLIPFITTPTKILLSPGRMYALSVVAFILARPLILLFEQIDLVQVGNGVTVENISKTLAIIALSIWMSAIGFSVGTFNGLLLLNATQKLRFALPSYTKHIAFSVFITFGLYFLYSSWVASLTLQTLDYFSAVEDPSYFTHVKYFFIAKLFAIAWLASIPSRNNFKVCAFLLLFFSSGFLLIGLRGYFIAYLFLYLYFFNETRAIKLWMSIVGSLCLLFGASFILEYRLGYDLFDSPLEMVTVPFYQQGATFEVVFGSVSFPEKITECISYVDYFMKLRPFGDCVDSARGVPFVQGGFASSFFAEAYYFGIVPLLVISVLFGVAVKFADTLSSLRTGIKSLQPSFGAGFILFLIIPNLVYFARSSAFDFLFKVLEVVIIFYFLYTSRPSSNPLANRSVFVNSVNPISSESKSR